MYGCLCKQESLLFKNICVFTKNQLLCSLFDKKLIIINFKIYNYVRN